MSTAAPQWFKSSYSSDQGECVEVALAETTIHVRDSKNPEEAPTLQIGNAAWAAFLAATA